MPWEEICGGTWGSPDTLCGGCLQCLLMQAEHREMECKKQEEQLREERDRYQELLQQVIEEWDYRGKHKYRDGAPAIIFDIRAELENEE